jgi:hypothetical protein
MAPLSGDPRKFGVNQIGKVRIKPTTRNAQEAKNFPITAWFVVIGRVKSNSRVPVRFSSDQRRMAMAGTRNRYNQGCQRKKDPKEASFLAKKSWPTMKVKKPESSKKITRNT